MARRRSKPYQPQDNLFHKAKSEGYHSRAAFKLQEVQKRFKILSRGHWVLDLGCTPGAWAQVASQAIGPKGQVIGIDLLSLPEQNTMPNNFFFIEGDIREPQCRENIRRYLQDQQKTEVQAVISDMAPKLSGLTLKDHSQMMDLARMALDSAEHFLTDGGVLLMKIFPGEELQAFRKILQTQFKQSKILQLDSTRASSREVYLLNTGFKRNG